ncbi:MAG: cation:proton antiporter [Nanoarchaeota archaeon]|nr:cation:proton antiporter [Nanoarchaeota archaeon]MBU1445337.1 cation:proton antiporter [Nanoarchaeota archaeon]MBU2420514.1 cation:proton antiporter [Nanoarchaeota archaeon]MBU2475128.1 cation:proton antiporter [Nanoarchaeota archaeon]
MDVANLITLNNLEITRFFFAIALLLISAHGFGYLFQRFKLPRVVGEIVGGLVLGPTILGFFAPNIFTWIFNAFEAEGKLISIIYWFGLVLLMFISGFSIQKSFSKEDKKTIFAILIGATIIPFIAGWVAPTFYDFSPFLGVKNSMPALKIVIAIAVAVTSIPVISRIFIDLKVINTRFAKIILTTATIQDVILWVALAIATGIVSAEALSISGIVSTILITLVFFGASLIIMPKLLKFSNNLRLNLLIKSSVTGYTLFICFFFVAIASILNVNIVFGAFLAGIVIGTMPNEKFGVVKTHIKEISLAFFIPIYFAVVGLKLDLIHNFNVLFFLGFLLFTTIFETIGTLIATKLTKKDWLTSFNFAVAMNTRGGPGIILATIAFDMGIINETFFVTLVMVAIITSILSGYWFKFMLLKGWRFLENGVKKTTSDCYK